MRVRSGIALLTSAALLIVACGSDDDSSDPAPVASDGGTGAAEGGEGSDLAGEINFATWWAYVDQDVVDGFTALHPDVTVNLEFTAIDSYITNIQAQASAGDLPDVFSIQGAPMTALAEADAMLTLDDALTGPAFDGDAASWGESFDQSLLAAANDAQRAEYGDDRTTGLPFNAISIASIYNADVFAEVGIEPATSFDELISNCVALDEAGYIPMSLTGAVWGTWYLLMALDQTMQNQTVEDFTPEDPNFLKGFEIIEEMANANCWDDSQITTDIAAETSLFLREETAQFVSVPENFLQSVVEGAEFELGTAPLPGLAGVDPVRVMGGGNANVIFIDADTENPEVAIAFAKYLTSEEVQTSLAGSVFTIPSLDIDLSSGNPLMGAYLEAASQGFVDTAAYLPTFPPGAQETLRDEIFARLVRGDITPAEAAASTAALFEE